MPTRIVGIIVLIFLFNVTIEASGELDNIDSNTEKNIIFSNKTDNLIVDLNGELLSIRAEDVTVEDIMAEIVRISGIDGWIFDGGQEKITMKFQNIPLQEGITRILKNKNYVFFYNQDENDGSVLRLIKSKQIPFPDHIGIAANTNKAVDVKATLKKLTKQGIKNLLKSIDKARITSLLSDTKSNISGTATEQQAIDNISSNINLDALRKLTSIGLTK